MNGSDSNSSCGFFNNSNLESLSSFENDNDGSSDAFGLLPGGGARKQKFDDNKTLSSQSENQKPLSEKQHHLDTSGHTDQETVTDCSSSGSHGDNNGNSNMQKQKQNDESAFGVTDAFPEAAPGVEDEGGGEGGAGQDDGNGSEPDEEDMLAMLDAAQKAEKALAEATGEKSISLLSAFDVSVELDSVTGELDVDFDKLEESFRVNSSGHSGKLPKSIPAKPKQKDQLQRYSAHNQQQQNQPKSILRQSTHGSAAKKEQQQQQQQQAAKGSNNSSSSSSSKDLVQIRAKDLASTTGCSIKNNMDPDAVIKIRSKDLESLRDFTSSCLSKYFANKGGGAAGGEGAGGDQQTGGGGQQQQLQGGGGGVDHLSQLPKQKSVPRLQLPQAPPLRLGGSSVAGDMMSGCRSVAPSVGSKSSKTSSGMSATSKVIDKSLALGMQTEPTDGLSAFFAKTSERLGPTSKRLLPACAATVAGDCRQRTPEAVTDGLSRYLAAKNRDNGGGGANRAPMAPQASARSVATAPHPKVEAAAHSAAAAAAPHKHPDSSTSSRSRSTNNSSSRSLRSKSVGRSSSRPSGDDVPMSPSKRGGGASCARSTRGSKRNIGDGALPDSSARSSRSGRPESSAGESSRRMRSRSQHRGRRSDDDNEEEDQPKERRHRSKSRARSSRPASPTKTRSSTEAESEKKEPASPRKSRPRRPELINHMDPNAVKKKAGRRPSLENNITTASSEPKTPRRKVGRRPSLENNTASDPKTPRRKAGRRPSLQDNGDDTTEATTPSPSRSSPSKSGGSGSGKTRLKIRSSTDNKQQQKPSHHQQEQEREELHLQPSCSDSVAGGSECQSELQSPEQPQQQQQEEEEDKNRPDEPPKSPTQRLRSRIKSLHLAIRG